MPKVSIKWNLHGADRFPSRYFLHHIFTDGFRHLFTKVPPKHVESNGNGDKQGEPKKSDHLFVIGVEEADHGIQEVGNVESRQNARDNDPESCIQSCFG